MFTTLYIYFKRIIDKFLHSSKKTTSDELDLIIETEVSLSPSSNVNENARFAFTYNEYY